jgi:hypothetical protein
VEPILPPPTPSHTWAELLGLVGAVRRLAFDRSLPPPEALGRIRTHTRTTTRGPSHRGQKLLDRVRLIDEMLRRDMLMRIRLELMI